MLVRRHPSAAAFLERASPFLRAHETENHLLIGIARDWADHPELYAATVEHDDRVVACALRTLPIKLLLSHAPDEAIDALVDDVATDQRDLSTVLGPEPESKRFATTWTARTGIAHRAGMKQRMYALHYGAKPFPDVPGSYRVATSEDFPALVPWVEEFAREVGTAISPDLTAATRRRVEAGTVYLWERDGKTVSMAACSGETPHGIRISLVFTPTEARGHGYATALVSRMSQMLLDQGRQFCALFADLDNPTACGVYESIGYQKVLDVIVYDFAP